MGTINPPIPKLGVTGSQPATDLVTSLTQILAAINGNLDAANLKDRGIDEFPLPLWKEAKVSPEMVLVGGLPVGGLPPTYKFGQQNLGGSWPAAPASNVLREMAILVKWSKSAKLYGGNDATNQLVFQSYNSEDLESGHSASPVLGILIPGGDGLRTKYSAGITTTPVIFTSPAWTSAAQVDQSGQHIILPTIGDTLTAVTTGSGLTAGVFTIHEFVLRYRDWEF